MPSNGWFQLDPNYRSGSRPNARPKPPETPQPKPPANSGPRPPAGPPNKQSKPPVTPPRPPMGPGGPRPPMIRPKATAAATEEASLLVSAEAPAVSVPAEEAVTPVLAEEVAVPVIAEAPVQAEEAAIPVIAEAPAAPVMARTSARTAAVPPTEAAPTLEPWDITAKHSQTVGYDGPVVLHDVKLHETLETFANAKIPERAVHVKGWGAFGHFQVTNSMADFTKASLFQRAGTKVPVTTRFSLAVSTRGTPDTSRNVRGFSTKFYTPDGVFDLLCNHLPVFLVRDAIRFPESIEAFLPNPKNNLVDPDRFWGFVASAPEATHFVTWLYSDVGTIKSLRNIHGFGVNTYVWRNAAGKRHFIKYHWLPMAGEVYINREEAAALAAQNPDLCGQDLFDTIEKGGAAEYQLCVQIMDPADRDALPFDPLDDTKIWDEEAYPLRPVGKLVLDRNTQDYMEQVEKIAFSPANLLDGIELSNDKMLEGRSFIYYDAQRHRLGADYRKLEINGQPNFTPADLPDTGLGQSEQGAQMRADLQVPDNFTQAGERYRSLSDVSRNNLVSNIAADLAQVSQGIQTTVLGYFRQADPDFADRVIAQMRKNSQTQ